MSGKDNTVYIQHMLECISRIQSYVESREHFYSSNLVQDAVARNLQTLAESSQRLSESLKDQHPETPWRAIAGFRNILVHDYLGLDLDVIWGVVDIELPKLQATLQRMAAEHLKTQS